MSTSNTSPRPAIGQRALHGTAISLALLALASLAGAQTTLVAPGATWRYFKGTQEPSSPVTDWRQIAFDDSTWLTGPAGIGYGDLDDATTLTDMMGSYASVYLRDVFDVADPTTIAGLQLRIDYDDGFVAYLNGVEIARRGLSGDPVPFNAYAVDHEASHQAAIPLEAIPLCDAQGLLVPGANVLAIQVHNSSLTSTDLTIIPALDALPIDPAMDGPYLQLARADSVLVRWHTTQPERSTVEYGPFTTPATFPLVASDPIPTTDHQIRLVDLRPGTNYSYRIQGPAGPRSPNHDFWTLVRYGARSFRFAVVGDSGTGGYIEHEVGKRIRERRPDFWLHAGDLVGPAGEAVAYDQQVFIPFAAAMAGSCLFPAMGDEDNATSSGQPWKDELSTFANNPPAEPSWYSFDVGDAHFTVIDTNQDYHAGAPMGDWLRADVLAPGRCWRFVVMHQPPYTSDPQFSLPAVQALRDDLAPVFEAAGVDIVFSAHVSAYERTFPLTSGNPSQRGQDPDYNDPAGPIYVVTGGGGDVLDTPPGASIMAHSTSSFGFAWVQIANTVLTLEARDHYGVLFDTMTITKACAADSDADTIPDTTDNCPFVANPGQTDLDTDSTGDACDPDVDGDGVDAPLDCDDLDATVTSRPGEVDQFMVAFAATSGSIDLSWAGQGSGSATLFQLLSGTLSDLWSDRGFARATCADPGTSGTTLTVTPPAGSLYYLARATSSCGHGTWGDSSIIPDPRDALDVPGTTPCPLALPRPEN